MSRLLKIIFCRISSLLYGSFAKETYHFKEPTNRSHPIVIHIYMSIHNSAYVCMFGEILLDKSPLGTPFSKVSFIAILYSHFGGDIHIYVHTYLCIRMDFWRNSIKTKRLLRKRIETTWLLRNWIGRNWLLRNSVGTKQLLRNSIGLKRLVRNECNKAAFEKFYRNTADFEKFC